MKPYFGAHISVSKGGIVRNLKSITDEGGNAVQIFIGSPLAKMTEKSFEDKMKVAPEVKQFLKENDIKLFIHSPYTLNFAKDPNSSDPYWVNAIIKELTIADAMGVSGCVLHMGKAVGSEIHVAKQNMSENIKRVISAMRENNLNTKLIIETSAGQGSELYPTHNNSIEPLKEFWSNFSSNDTKYLGICVDTCHIFASGYDISTIDQVRKFFDEFDKSIGLKHLQVVHMNNSVGKLGSCVDRHACLHYGMIPFEGLAEFGKICYQKGIPVILETPGAIREVWILKDLAKKT